MTNECRVVPLTRRPKDVLRFLNVACFIYRDDPHWVAPLVYDIKKVFSDENPFFAHAEMQLWVATRNGQDIGRIAAVLDRRYNEVQGDHAVFFGFFESVHDHEVSAA